VWDIRCAGAGYESRYASGLDTRLHGIYSDDYITTEVLIGHPGKAKPAFGRDVVRKYWLLHDLTRELALRRIESVEFAGGNLHRQYVRWDNGGEVWVNRGAFEMRVGFYNPNGGARLLPEGAADGTSRLRLGSIPAGGRWLSMLYPRTAPCV
jgi:hypothetical protein